MTEALKTSLLVPTPQMVTAGNSMCSMDKADDRTVVRTGEFWRSKFTNHFHKLSVPKKLDRLQINEISNKNPALEQSI